MKKSQNEKFKIAMIGHKRIPSREGGVEVVVEELSKRYAKWGYNVTVFNRAGHHISGKKYDNTNCTSKYKEINVVKVPTIKIKGMAAVSSSFFATISAIFMRFDVIHYHAEGPCVMIFLAHLFKIHTVATIHGLDWKRAKWSGLAKNYIKLGEKIAAKYADQVIVLSESMKSYFKNNYNRDTIYLPNGIAKVQKKEVDIINKNWDLQKNNYLLYLGRIVPEKGLEYLIKAFKNLDTEKKLVIAGGASDTNDFYDKMVQLAKDDKRIMFIGFVQGSILEELYSNAYIYVLPSDLEGMPLTLLEAMSYGNCCVVSNIPECTEVIQDKGLIFKKGDIKNLYNILEKCCNDVNLVQSYKNSSENYILTKYNWDDIAKLTLQIYKNTNS